MTEYLTLTKQRDEAVKHLAKCRASLDSYVWYKLLAHPEFDTNNEELVEHLPLKDDTFIVYTMSMNNPHKLYKSYTFQQ